MFNKAKIEFELVRNVKPPERGTKGSAGLDFFIPNLNDSTTKKIVIEPGGAVNIPSGVKCKIKEDFALIAFNKSGIALNTNLLVGACVIDSDYEGEIHLHVINVSKHRVVIQSGMKLVQFLLIPVDHSDIKIVNKIVRESKSERGTFGFGSTNK